MLLEMNRDLGEQCTFNTTGHHLFGDDGDNDDSKHLDSTDYRLSTVLGIHSNTSHSPTQKPCEEYTIVFTSKESKAQRS